MNSKIKNVLSLLVTGCALFGVQRFCRSQTDGFALHKICSELSFHPEWEVESHPESLGNILDQPYRYLAKGAQSYVFASEDGQYVIKFFRIYHMEPPRFLTHLHWPLCVQGYRLSKIIQKQEELNRDFTSYKIAYDHLKEETGLLFLHLNKTETLKKSLTLIDKLGIAYQIDLDQMEFLVQKRAKIAYPALAQITEEQGIDAGKAALTRLVSLLALRIEKNIKDKDPDLNTNFGFINTQAVQIDVGRFRIDPSTPPLSPLEKRDEVIRITDNLDQWLRVQYPELSTHLQQEIRCLASS